MTFDFHFDDGRHEKHSNWTMWSIAMLLLRHYNIWSDDQLEAELMQLAMRKTSQGQVTASRKEKVTVGEDGEDGSVKKGASASTAKKIERYMKGKTLTISVEQIGEAEDEDSIVEAYAAKIEIRNLKNSWKVPLHEAPKFVQKHFSETAEEAVKWAVESTKLTKRLVEALSDAETPMKEDLFVRLISNDGNVITPNESTYLMSIFMGGLKSLMTDQNLESLEILRSRFVAMVGHFGYAAGSGQNFKVY